MSNPKQYTDLQVWEALHFGGSTNGWIRWEDYKRIVDRINEASLDAINVKTVLKAENARLKAEVERLTQEASKLVDYQNSQCEPNTRGYYLKLLNQSYEQSNEYYRLFVVERSKAGMAEDEIKNLKAEVERLRASSFVTAVPVEEYEKLKAEVERLRKAGDWMYNALILNSDKDISEGMYAWSAAKEGKPSV